MRRYQKGFAPMLVLVVLILIIGAAYLSRVMSVKVNNLSPTPAAKPVFAPTNARTTKINSEWGRYEDLNYKFSFEFPWSDGVKLDESQTRIEYPQPLSNGYVSYFPATTVSYFVNSQKLSLEQFMSKDGSEGYYKYNPVGNNIQVYINRTAPGADINQSFYVLSPDGKFVLVFTCFEKDAVVNHILSTLKFE